MSFPVEFHNDFYPEDIKIMKSLYAAVSSEPWFTKDEDRRAEFARKLMSFYRRGMILPDKLQDLCFVMARRSYSEPGSITEEGQKDPR